MIFVLMNPTFFAALQEQYMNRVHLQERYFLITGADRVVELFGGFRSGRVYCIAIATHG
jgi:hypothetical protein